MPDNKDDTEKEVMGLAIAMESSTDRVCLLCLSHSLVAAAGAE